MPAPAVSHTGTVHRILIAPAAPRNSKSAHPLLQNTQAVPCVYSLPGLRVLLRCYAFGHVRPAMQQNECQSGTQCVCLGSVSGVHMRPPELKLRTPAPTKNPGGHLAFEFRGGVSQAFAESNPLLGITKHHSLNPPANPRSTT